jgi:hypothetical protein
MIQVNQRALRFDPQNAAAIGGNYPPFGAAFAAAWPPTGPDLSVGFIFNRRSGN